MLRGLNQHGRKRPQVRALAAFLQFFLKGQHFLAVLLELIKLHLRDFALALRGLNLRHLRELVHRVRNFKRPNLKGDRRIDRHVCSLSRRIAVGRAAGQRIDQVLV